jgi:hypothetical protein
MTSTQLLPFRAEQNSVHFAPSAPRSITSWASPPPHPVEPSVVIHCAGQDFLVKKSLAEIFLRHARNILASGGSELTPLLHAGGVELILITPSTAAACLVEGRALLSTAQGVFDPAVP